MDAATLAPYEDPDLRRVTDQAIRPGGIELTDRAVRLAAPAPGSVALDVGCGCGVTVRRLAQRYGLAAMGVDPSAVLIAAGRARCAGLPLLRGRAEALPLPDSSVRTAFAECVLSLVADPGRALAELSRVLQPGGRLVLSDLYPRDPQAAAALRRLPPRSCLRGAPTRDHLLELLSTHGFRVTVWEDHSRLLTRLAARLVWERGSAADLWCPGAPTTEQATVRAAVLASRPGYFLLLADLGGE